MSNVQERGGGVLLDVSTATHCNALQHTATHERGGHRRDRCNALQRTATHYNALQHTTTHCNTRERGNKSGDTRRYIIDIQTQKHMEAVPHERGMRDKCEGEFSYVCARDCGGSGH